ncbi:MAG: phage baseplate assembly protein V [Synergistaceae bacterium]|nr:phage baseplate assembly protein V [Synergistaceae bacterium]
MDSESERRFANLIQFGEICEVEPEKGLCRVDFGDRVSPSSPWLMERCGDDKDFWHPDLHEQVVFLSPFGDGSEGLVLRGVPSNKKPLPTGAREGLYIKEFKDGTRIEVDRNTHVINIKDSYGSYIRFAGGYIYIAPAIQVKVVQGGA